MSFLFMLGSGHGMGMRWWRAKASTHCWYSRVRFCQGLPGEGIDPVHVAEEMDDVLGPRPRRQVALDDDAVETRVYKSQQAAEQLAEGSIGLLGALAFDNKIIRQRAGGIQGSAA